MMGKKYDFDKLFDGARDTVEYWQERHEIAHGEMLARDAEIEALKARIAKLEAERRSRTRGLRVAFGAWPGDESDEEIAAALGETE